MRAPARRFDYLAGKNGTYSRSFDAAGGGLYLLITPDPNKAGKAGSKLWRMAYRFHGRQKACSIGPYGNGNDGTVSLATAHQKRETIALLQRWAGYLKDRFGRLYRPDIKRPDVLAFFRGEGRPADRVHSIGGASLRLR